MLVISSEKERKTATKLDECKFGFRIYRIKNWIVKKNSKKFYCFKINCLLLVAVVELVLFIFCKTM